MASLETPELAREPLAEVVLIFIFFFLSSPHISGKETKIKALRFLATKLVFGFCVEVIMMTELSKHL